MLTQSQTSHRTTATNQIAVAARKAAALYQLFLNSISSHPNSGQLPDRLHGDDEPHALRAAFHAGCMLNTAMRLEGGLGGSMGLGTTTGALQHGSSSSSSAGGGLKPGRCALGGWGLGRANK